MLADIVPLLLAGSGTAAYVYAKKGKTCSYIGATGAVLALLLTLGHRLCCRSGLWDDGALYQLPIVFVGIASSLYAPGYLACHDEGRTGFFWLFFNLTICAMLGVTAAQGKYSFLVCWELMGLCSFFLVGFELKSLSVMRAAWIYLLGCEAGGMLLMLAFALGNHMSIELCFAILVIGFGLKAGFPLLHVWLPEAHPAAPAPVSALMSGAMIPLGFCGLFRFMPKGGDLSMTCGWTLLILGMLGSFSGILFALGQRNLKRLLAYSSIENIGIMAMGFGMGFLGIAYRMPVMANCGWLGGMLHLLNHALLKGTLFLGAGTVLCSAKTLDMDLLGGMMKKLPLTGGIFTVASLGICGLPPFCAFMSEVLIYGAAFAGIVRGEGALTLFLPAAAVVLALTGGCACTVFAKAVSAVFQGEPRTDFAIRAEEEKREFVLPLLILLIPVLGLPLLPLWVSRAAAGTLFPGSVFSVLYGNAVMSLLFYALGAILMLGRLRFEGASRRSVTWDCGYARPTGRMEYTGTAFVQPVADCFDALLRQKKTQEKPQEIFPEKAAISVETPDYSERGLWRPLFHFFGAAAEKIHRVQSGHLHLYILFMVLALALMLLWGFFSRIEVK